MKEKKAKRSSGGISWIFGYLGFGVGAIGMDLSYGLFNSFLTKYLTDVLLLNATFLLIVPTLARIWDGINDPMMGTIVDNTKSKFGKFRPFMVIGNLIMAVSILVLYGLTPLIPASMEWARYVAFVALYAIWVIGYTFQTSCTRSGQTVLTNDPKQRPLFTIFNTVGSLLGMGAMQFFAPILAKNYEGGYASAGFFRTLAPVGIVISEPTRRVVSRMPSSA